MSALAYVRTNGYMHQDVKLENLGMTERPERVVTFTADG
jgi:hypothetical protein